MSKSTIKSGRRKGFIVLYREAVQDARLTLEARGLFALMASLPENWEYTVSGLAVKAGCGKDKVRRLLKELQAVGYLVREQSHDQGGKFAANVYVLQDEAPPLSGNTDNGENRQRSEPSTEKPSTDFAAQKNKEIKNTDLKDPPKAPQGASGSKPKRGRAPKSAPDWKPERFEGFWRMYPLKKSKQAAIRAWDSLHPDDRLLAVMGACAPASAGQPRVATEDSRGGWPRNPLSRHLD